MKFSFIVPVYNVEKFLRRCLDSIMAQDESDWEAVCVNDGSTDSSLEILKEYAMRDSRFRIVNKSNGGLSSARNAGMKECKGEFIVYVDSDDFIHPQTLSISSYIQQKSGADIVSWYKNSNYRTQSFLRHIFHLDTVNYLPGSYGKRYDLSSLKWIYTEDPITISTEKSHPADIKHPLKHHYVWRHLIRRSLIQDISFLEGVNFEDFPWWSEVLLKNPKVAYNMLPLYYYFVNFDSIDMASKRSKKVLNWVDGLTHTYEVYSQKADKHQMLHWSKNFKWPVITYHLAHKLSDVESQDPLRSEIVSKLQLLLDKGCFDDPSRGEDVKSIEIIRNFVRL